MELVKIKIMTMLLKQKRLDMQYFTKEITIEEWSEKSEAIEKELIDFVAGAEPTHESQII